MRGQDRLLSGSERGLTCVGKIEGTPDTEASESALPVMKLWSDKKLQQVGVLCQNKRQLGCWQEWEYWIKSRTHSDCVCGGHRWWLSPLIEMGLDPMESNVSETLRFDENKCCWLRLCSLPNHFGSHLVLCIRRHFHPMSCHEQVLKPGSMYRQRDETQNSHSLHLSRGKSQSLSFN